MDTHADTGTAPTLDALEWQAVSVALKDAATCGCGDVARPGAITRALRSVLGVRPPQPLADPRLEAVRRFVCVTRRRGGAERDAAALASHGYNRRQIAALALLSR